MRAVSEYGLGRSVGPVSVSALAGGGGGDDLAAALSMRGASASRAAEDEVGEGRWVGTRMRGATGGGCVGTRGECLTGRGECV